MAWSQRSALPLVFVTRQLLAALLWLVDGLADLPLAGVPVPRLPLAAVIVYYTALPLALVLLNMPPRRRLQCSVGAFVLFLGVVVLSQ